MSSGRASLFTFTIVHRSPHPAFQADVPFVVALVKLEEGPLIATNIVDLPEPPGPEDLRIGMAMEVAFDDVTDQVTLPKFRPA